MMVLRISSVFALSFLLGCADSFSTHINPQAVKRNGDHLTPSKHEGRPNNHHLLLTLRQSVRCMALKDDDEKGGNTSSNNKYSRDLYLREEAESPFRKVRFFVYASLAGGALTSLAVSGARIAAALAGINADLLQESATNAAVDVLGLAVLAFLFQRDLQAQESRLKRASKGAELARLTVRVSKRLIQVDDDDDEGEEVEGGYSSRSGSAGKGGSFTTNLSSLRRGRGMEKRVVIAVGGPDRITDAMKEVARLQDSLVSSDLLVVPVVLPFGVAPDGATIPDPLPDCLALPVGNNWKTVVKDEADEAARQGIDVSRDGFCVILKKNGRIGQRTKGIALARMVGEVSERRELGMDVTNI